MTRNIDSQKIPYNSSCRSVSYTDLCDEEHRSLSSPEKASAVLRSHAIALESPVLAQIAAESGETTARLRSAPHARNLVPDNQSCGFFELSFHCRTLYNT